MGIIPMEDVRIYKNIEMPNPAMIAGWPGMGSVALGVVDYLRRHLKAVKFAEIKIDPIAALDSVMVEKGHAFTPPPPRHAFYYVRNPDLIIFQGEIQIPGREGIALLKKALELASRFNVSRIYTGAALPSPVGYNDAPEVYGAANSKQLASALKDLNIRLMEGGHISGSNGLMLSFAREKKIDAICLLATMPQYAVGLPNPRASMAIIEILRSVLRFDIDLSELEEHAKIMGERLAVIEDKVKDVMVIDGNAADSKDEKDVFGDSKNTPPYIKDKIEKLFYQTRQDRAKAVILKKELDRWGLYKVYEDRFLDLFRQD